MISLIHWPSHFNLQLHPHSSGFHFNFVLACTFLVQTTCLLKPDLCATRNFSDSTILFLSMVGKWRAFSMSDIGLNRIQETQSAPARIGFPSQMYQVFLASLKRLDQREHRERGLR